MKAESKCFISFTSFFVLVCSMEPAHAYLDPGSGSMIIQDLLAVIVASGVSIGIFRNPIKLFFSRIFGGNRRDQQGPNEKTGNGSR